MDLQIPGTIKDGEAENIVFDRADDATDDLKKQMPGIKVRFTNKAGKTRRIGFDELAFWGMLKEDMRLLEHYTSEVYDALEAEDFAQRVMPKLVAATQAVQAFLLEVNPAARSHRIMRVRPAELPEVSASSPTQGA
jgi:hypothetical protein